MLSNYLLSAFRNLRKHPGYTFINLTGLALGTACCLYILLYVRDHRSYDQLFSDNERIYRVVSDLGGMQEGSMSTASVSPPIVSTMAADFGEIEQFTRLVDPPEVSKTVLRNGNRTFFETRGFYADSTFFKVFDFPFAAGSPERCLDEPNTVVLNYAVAEKLFGDVQQAVGQSITIENRFYRSEFRITGVLDKNTGKNHIDGHFYMSMRSGPMGEFVLNNQSFAGQNFIFGYVKLMPNTDPLALTAKLPAFLEKHGGDQLRQMGMQKTLHLEPLADIHTKSLRRNQLSPTVQESFLNLLVLLALFIQIIACINFMNLSTARASQRAKEVGVRKALGAGKTTLVYQFLGESMLLATLAISLALPMVAFSLPWINLLTGASVSLNSFNDTNTWWMFGGLLMLTGLVAGSYPAFYLSGLQPIRVLKGLFHSENRGGAKGLRKSLVAFQFVIAIALISAAVIVRAQFKHLAGISLGFEKAQKIVIPFETDESRQSLASFEQEAGKISGVEAVGATTTILGEFTARDLGIYPEGGQPDKLQLLRYTVCDEHYLPSVKIELLSGRGFTQNDTFNQLIINEQAAKAIGHTAESAIGRKVYSSINGETSAFEIIGVVKDFNYESLYEGIKPYGFLYAETGYNQYAVLSVKGGDMQESVQQLEGLWQRLVPGLPFSYSFLEDSLQKQYAADQILFSIISVFTLLALIISCMGLFGLAAFTAEQRTKEIGIRKVLGASPVGIVRLLANDFIKLIVIALIPAIPVAWYFMQHWLENFAYRIDIQWWMFVLAGVLTALIATLTVSYQSIKAALSNPVKSLRSE